MGFNFRDVKSQSQEILKINKKLPQIKVSKKNIQFFYDWWNTDIRFETTVPQVFTEGYLILDNCWEIDTSNGRFNKFISAVAKQYKLTFRQVEQEWLKHVESGKHLTIYFKFITSNKLFVQTFGKDNKIWSQATTEFGDTGEPEQQISFNDEVFAMSMDASSEIFNFYNLALLITCMWYIATTTKTTKYVYEQKHQVVTSRTRGIVKVSDTKVISTPIYDMDKIRVVKIDSLVARKKGWTYSHSFQVHGHYRHYKNGKTIFIQPFIKGKGKDFKSQVISLEPTLA